MQQGSQQWWVHMVPQEVCSSYNTWCSKWEWHNLDNKMFGDCHGHQVHQMPTGDTNQHWSRHSPLSPQSRSFNSISNVKLYKTRPIFFNFTMTFQFPLMCLDTALHNTVSSFVVGLLCLTLLVHGVDDHLLNTCRVSILLHDGEACRPRMGEQLVAQENSGQCLECICWLVCHHNLSLEAQNFAFSLAVNHHFSKLWTQHICIPLKWHFLFFHTTFFVELLM